MKKILILSLFLLIAPPVHALSWSTSFVVWDGLVYEIKLEEHVEESKIGRNIGKVETKPDQYIGEYEGNASNHYPIGTKYYTIKGISTSKSIAVQESSEGIRADFIHEAPFHIKDVLKSSFFLSSFNHFRCLHDFNADFP